MLDSEYSEGHYFQPESKAASPFMQNLQFHLAMAATDTCPPAPSLPGTVLGARPVGTRASWPGAVWRPWLPSCWPLTASADASPNALAAVHSSRIYRYMANSHVLHHLKYGHHKADLFHSKALNRISGGGRCIWHTMQSLCVANCQ